MGADVVKVEGPGAPDHFRNWDGAEPGTDWWNRSPFFNFTNRGKRALCIDLKDPRGREAVLRLLDGADVLVENCRRGVMASFGLAPTMLRERFPRLVIGSISSQGETGPDRDMVSFGSTLEATAGLAALTGAGEAPVITGRDVNYPDQVVCLQGYIIALPGVLTHVRSGAIRAIALASDRRSQVMPELVTTVEQGFPRIIGASWFGPATRVGTPPGRLARLIEAFQATMTDPAIRRRLEDAGLDIPADTGADSYRRLIREDFERRDRVARRAGLRRQ